MPAIPVSWRLTTLVLVHLIHRVVQLLLAELLPELSADGIDLVNLEVAAVVDVGRLEDLLTVLDRRLQLLLHADDSSPGCQEICPLA